MVRWPGRYDHRIHNLLRFLRCTACGILEMLPGRTDYKISRSEKRTLPLSISHMSSDTEDSDGLGIFVVCKEITWHR